MRIDSTYLPPTLGISTLADKSKQTGMAKVQENFRSDPVHKLTRRPASKWLTRLLPNEQTMLQADATVKYHSFNKDGDTYRILVSDTGIVACFKNTDPVPVVGDLTNYIDSVHMRMVTIDDNTYITNVLKVVEQDDANDVLDIETVTHINVIAALNYGETVTITVKGTTNQSFSVTVPDVTGGDYAVADAYRATNNIAELLQAGLDLLSGVNCIVKGSSVAVWDDSGSWVDLEVSSGQGERSIIIVNQVIEKVEGMPLYAVHGTRITVRPNPRSEKGTYYLQAESIDETVDVAPDPASRIMTEVVWAEHRSPLHDYKFKNETMPHIIKWDRVANTVEVKVEDWDERTTGDNDSCPFPDFVGKVIRDIALFQTRLVFLTKENVSMTETDNSSNWFKNSAIKTLVTDPIGISSSAVDVDSLSYITPHNRDLLISSANSQFKIDGSVAVTPQHVSMPLTTSYECTTSAPPLSFGNSVYLPTTYGTSAGVLEYSGQRDTSQDEGVNITPHIIGYMQGDITILKGSSNLDMVAVVTKAGGDNVIFIYEFYKSGAKRIQQAWSTWILPQGTIIQDIIFNDDTMEIVSEENGNIILKAISMYSHLSSPDSPVYLDNIVSIEVLQGATQTFTLPPYYLVNADLVVVQGSGCAYPYELAEFTIVEELDGSHTVTLPHNPAIEPTAVVTVGLAYTSRYIPNRPFRQSKAGTITTDRIRVSHWELDVERTGIFFCTIHSHYVNIPDQEFTPRILNAIDNLLVTSGMPEPTETGIARFSYAQDASLADVEFWSAGHLPLTISAISWSGQYFQSSDRM